MRIVDIIEKKKVGKELNKEEITQLIMGYVNKEVPDYQMAAFQMAVYFQGMTSKETAILTDVMMHSGEIIDLSDIKGIKVDKHSTGGIGDKTTIAVAPIVASLGVPVAKMSGRGLGFTGGTLDKLESIPGYKVELSDQEFKDQVNSIGIAVISQTGDVVPADKLMYALRDVTATVNSLPLIAASIMSKKLATGSDSILLDVKVGDGAFMKTYKEAEELAKAMIAIGKELGRDVRAEITNMDRPLGKAIGNKNEVLEAIETLKGNGPKDFVEIVESAVATMLVQSKTASTYEDGIKKCRETISSGAALEKFKEWIKVQHGDSGIIFTDKFWNPKFKHEVKAEKDGFMIVDSAVAFGLAAMKLGAGRETKADELDFDAGINLEKKTNDVVKAGETLFTLYSSREIKEEIVSSLKNAYNISDSKIENKIILGKLG